MAERDTESARTTPDPALGHGDGVRPAPDPPRRRPLYRRRWFLVVSAAVLLLLTIGAAGYWWYASGRVSTDDAFIEGRIVRISTQVAGQVARLAVTDNQVVKEGDLLVQIDDRESRAQAEQAAAEARAAQVAAESAAADARRAEQLFDRQLIARQALDLAVATERSRAAQADAARKRAAETALRLSFTRITSPEGGRVTRRMIEEGAYVQVGQVLVTIVPNDFWVVANFKETQLDKVRPGQPVDIKVDAYPGMRLRGHVDSVQAGVQRVPVKIVFDELPADPALLGPGMSVVPTVRVR